MKGYTGKTIEVDLAGRKIEFSDPPDEIKIKFIGGSGLGARLFLDRVDPRVDPFSPDNILFILTGPITGTTLPGTSRFTVCSRSPQTGIFGEASCGGNFGAEIKAAGYDGIILKGASDSPVILEIDDGRVEIKPANDLWGKDIYEVTDHLKAASTGARKVKVFAIGPGGENLVKFAAIGNDKGHFAGRTGMGAVMGSKKVKAIVVRGSGKVEPALKQEYDELRKRCVRKCKESVPAQSIHEMGSDAAMDLGMMTGDVPIKNWQVAQDLELSSALGGPSMKEKFLTRTHACYSCPIACKRVVRVESGPFAIEEGPGPEYETCAIFGTMLMNKDLAGVLKANEVCNRLGVDTISCGATIAFAMEAYEKGIITKKDTDGLELTWGNIGAAIEMIKRISLRQGIGDILSEGVRGASRKLGKGSEDFALEVKGLEVPMHDPRAFHGMGLAYAVGNRGACHLQHLDLPVEQGMTAFTEIGLKEMYDGQSSEGKAEMHFISENLGIPANSACICEYVLYAISPQDFADMLRTTTGHPYDVKELMACGGRIWLLKRGINNLMGVTAKDDYLPKRILTAHKEGPAENSAPDIKKLLQEYYALRGVDERGFPRKEKLLEAGLSELAKKLYG